jgi:hypothetical protein
MRLLPLASKSLCVRSSVTLSAGGGHSSTPIVTLGNVASVPACCCTDLRHTSTCVQVKCNPPRDTIELEGGQPGVDDSS